MINIVPIKFTSIEEIKSNANFYKDKFINDSVVVFRDANLTHEQHVEINKVFGEQFGWFNFEAEPGQVDNYVEDHARIRNILNTSSDEIVVFWHIEHVYYKNPIIAATWNMLTFNTNNENGKTYFIDSSKLFEKLKDEWKTFLDVSLVGDNFNKYSPIGYHWITNKPVIRLKIDKMNGYTNTISSINGTNKLISVNGKTPTEEEYEMFNDICIWFNNEVSTNEDLRMVHKWEKGDLVLVDLFKLAHAVTGGFNPIDRKFVGIWGYKYPQKLK